MPKTVAAYDVKELVAQCYIDCVDSRYPIHTIMEEKQNIAINVNSVCVYVFDNNFPTAPNEVEHKRALEKFSKRISELSFGNLKVTHYSYKFDKNSNFHNTKIYIAMQYQIAD